MTAKKAPAKRPVPKSEAEVPVADEVRTLVAEALARPMTTSSGASVVLIAPDSSTVTVTSLQDFYNKVYTLGYTCQSGSVHSNYLTLAGITPTSNDPNAVLRLSDFTNSQSALNVTLRAAFAPLSKPLEGVPLTVYGHSFTTMPGSYCTPNGGEWQARVASRLGAVPVSLGVSGARMIEVATAAIGTAMPGVAGDKSYPAGKRGVVVVEAEMNDLILTGRDDPASQTGFGSALRALLATVTAAQRIESSSATQDVGAWSTFSSEQASGGSLLYAATQNAQLTFSGVTAPTGYVYLLTLANDSTSVTGDAQFLVDGVPQGGTYTGMNQMKGFTSATAGAASYTFSPHVIKLTVPSTGSHTVSMKKTDASTNAVYCDALLIPSQTPPLVIVCKDPAIANPPASSTNAGYYATYAPIYHGLIDSVTAEFPADTVHVVDLNQNWVPATMAATLDGAHFHPNDFGMSAIADTITTELLGLAGGFSAAINVL